MKKLISIFLICAILLQLTPIQLTATDNILDEQELICTCESTETHLEDCPLYTNNQNEAAEPELKETEPVDGEEKSNEETPVDGETDSIENTTETEEDSITGDEQVEDEEVEIEESETENIDEEIAEESPVEDIPVEEEIVEEEVVEILTVYEQLMNVESLSLFWDVFMKEDNKESILVFTVDEITSLKEKIENLYAVLESPSDDDLEIKEMLIETLNYLPAMECPECGEFDGHADDCVRNAEILVNDPTNGMTLTADTSIGAQTLKSGTEVVWNIPEGVTLTITGTILLQNNTKLTVTGGGRVLRKTSSTLFDIEDTCTLNLNGITIDGENQTFKYPVAQTTADDKVSNIIINNTTIKNINMEPSIDKNTGRGVITIFMNSKNKGSKCRLTVTNSVFENCSAFTGAAILFQDNVKCVATISNTVFRNIKTAQGGAIRTSGGSGVTLTLNQCVFKDNIGQDTLFSSKTAGYTNGAAIYWNACGSDLNGNRASVAIADCQFINNNIIYGGSSVEDGCGGAIYNEAFMSISSNYSSNFTLSETTPGNIRGNLIMGNSASNMGGGIMVPTYSGGMSAHVGLGATLDLDESVFIINNSAPKGGGIAMSVGLGTVGGNNPATSGVEYNIVVNGATITNNTASIMGGGIYLEREAGKDYYPSTIDLLSGVISYNTAPRGGALAVYNASNAESNYINEVTIGSNAGSLIMEENIATNGDNTGFGGAVYVSYGNVTMDNGILTANNAKYGGAVYVNAGQFVMNGGTVQNCTAINNGGAISVVGGNITIFDGTIQGCSAVNGGAIYAEGGNIDMYNGIIDGNSASANGGAIYATSNSMNIVIHIYDGEITNNTAGKHAGAIGASVTGSYSATINIGHESCLGVNTSVHDDNCCPLMQNNTASVSGGAICLHSESDQLAVNIYCGLITDNIAVRYEGTNNINQEGGVLTVYGGEIGAGISVGLGTYIDLRPGADERTLTIRLWSNYEGGSSEPVLITCTLGVSLNLPANVYTWEGHELSGWTTIPNTQVGWNPVGALFTVQETTDKYMDMYAVWDAEVSYIVYIPDTVNIDENGVGQMTLHAELNYFKENSNLSVSIQSDFTLTGLNSLDVLNYEIRTSEKGVTDAVNSGDIVATYQHNNTIDKVLTFKVLSNPKYVDTYQDIVTFVVDYEEIIY